jgi:hypothetical protein
LLCVGDTRLCYFQLYGIFFPRKSFAGLAVQFSLSPSGEILPKRRKKNGDMSHIKGCFENLMLFSPFCLELCD